VKEKSLLLETVANYSFKNEKILLPAEKKWIGTFTYRDRKQISARPYLTPGWRLRDKDAVFQDWWRRQGIASVFFDGASKGNPGNAGAGRVIYSSDGSRKDNFSWGLGQRTNNQAEILGLLKACQIARENGIKEIQVFGDSEILIKILNTNDHLSNPVINKTLLRIRQVLQDFSSSRFFHILRGSNKEADTKANIGCLLPLGVLNKNDEDPQWIPIP
jgi:ribonuclease HI